MVAAVQAQLVRRQPEALPDQVGIGAGTAHPFAEIAAVKRAATHLADKAFDASSAVWQIFLQPFLKQVFDLQK